MFEMVIIKFTNYVHGPLYKTYIFEILRSFYPRNEFVYMAKVFEILALNALPTLFGVFIRASVISLFQKKQAYTEDVFYKIFRNLLSILTILKIIYKK